MKKAYLSLVVCFSLFLVSLESQASRRRKLRENSNPWSACHVLAGAGAAALAFGVSLELYTNGTQFFPNLDPFSSSAEEGSSTLLIVDGTLVELVDLRQEYEIKKQSHGEEWATEWVRPLLMERLGYPAQESLLGFGSYSLPAEELPSGSFSNPAPSPALSPNLSECDWSQVVVEEPGEMEWQEFPFIFQEGPCEGCSCLQMTNDGLSIVPCLASFGL